ncbi:hypothetical protein DFP72DRAFT_865491 [Ephemerocybe angulata]|uniref:Uncharacterized protein n=1 Tax=Ephemerocybe angulata TaxID=980116 RepID=A0A8H6IKD0_9AGAR|nr:hypothetical protein DFP72DRAFT_865491 [Tulosesus angulatus]
MPSNAPFPARNPDYLRPSPVRGQLEPQSSRSPQGWRYIQTTDTPNEFKVLLPPGTAAMYDYLLKLETYELTKKSSINWERLMQMRHLKDRMIRKCQRLGHVSTGSKKVSQGGAFVFQSLVAPSDFRLKEMEKWFREQERRVAAKAAANGGDKAKAGAKTQPPASTSRALVPTSKPTRISHSSTNLPAPDKQQRDSTVHHRKSLRTQRSMSLPVAVQETTPSRPFSPAPLPMLLVAQRAEYGLEPSPVDMLAGERIEYSELGVPNESESGANTPDSNAVEGTAVGAGHLRRRRSCIKRSSMSDLVKRVSWSDAQDLDQQVSRYAAAAKHAQSSGTWSEVRTLYLEQIYALNRLHEQVREGLDSIRVESDHLLRVEATIQRQRDSLEGTFKDFESKHTQFQEKVKEAISEATNNLTNVNLRLELPPINETSFNESS